MTTLIDAAWIAARSEPYQLSSAGETYELATNVTVNGTAFLVTASGITLDLKGYTVTYNNASRILVPNQDFANATGGVPDNWDVSGLGTYSWRNVAGSNLAYPAGLFGTKCLRVTLPYSSQAGSCTAATGNPCTITTGASHGLSTGDYVILTGFAGYQDGSMYGSRVLMNVWKVTVTGATTFTVNANITSLSDAAGSWRKVTDTLLSSPISITTANRLYASYVQPACNPALYPTYWIAARLEKSDGTEIAPWNYYKEGYGGNMQAVYAGNNRNFVPIAMLKPEDTSDVRLRIALASERTSGTIDVDLGRARFSQAYDTGVHAGGDNYIQWPPRDNHGNSVTDLNGLTVKDTVGGGAIVQGANRGFRGDAFCTHRVCNANILDTRIFITGDDVYAVRVWANNVTGDTTIARCNIEYDTDVDISARFYAPAAIWVSRVAGQTDVDSNVITNNPAWGISAYGLTTLVHGNSIYPNITKTNGYQLVAVNGGKIYGNLVDARNGSGRGIYCAAGQNATLNDVEIYGNDVYVRELPNVEYFSAITTRALRVRNTENGGTTNGTLLNINIHDNYLQAETQEEDTYSNGCYGAFISVRYNGNGMDTTSFRFTNNTCVAIGRASTTGVAGLCIGQWADSNASPVFDGNVLESNQSALQFGASDDSGSPVIGVTLTNTEFIKNATSGGGTWKPILVGYSTSEHSGIRLLNNTFTNCAFNELAWSGTGTREISVGWFVDVHTKRTGTEIFIAGVDFTITDAEATEVIAGQTGIDGTYAGVELPVATYTKVGSNPVQTTTLTPHTIDTYKLEYGPDATEFTQTNSGPIVAFLGEAPGISSYFVLAAAGQSYILKTDS